ncbi:MAG: response regulator transcription factor [Blastocatellia bacterium]
MDNSGAKHIRVLLVDDHLVVRTGLRMIIDSQPDMKMVGEAGNRAEALALAASENPDIILLDLDMGDFNGTEIIADLLAAANAARIIILTGMRSTEVYKKALMLGAMGIVAKDKAADVLINAIKVVRRGEAWLDPATTASMLGEMSRAPKPKTPDPEAEKIATLTNREREVVTLIGEGIRNKEIADRLFISETTVRHHLTSIFDKLDVGDRVELLIYAYKHKLADPPR